MAWYLGGTQMSTEILFVGLMILALWFALDRLIGLYQGPNPPPAYPEETVPERISGEEHAILASPQELRDLPYGEYLQTPHWKRKREEKIRAVGRRCQVCNQGPGPLDVHHRTYERLGEELDVDLTALCRSCHHLFHEHGRLSR